MERNIYMQRYVNMPLSNINKVWGCTPHPPPLTAKSNEEKIALPRSPGFIFTPGLREDHDSVQATTPAVKWLHSS